ncbi:MAG: RNA-binding cell elongation regulator Jag/EloR [Deltaproteobacteria bacterium]
MERIEIEGKTIDEAIEKACSQFQVSREKLNIEIIAAGTPGFLGMGAKKAKIRASRLSIDMSLEDIFSRVETLPPIPTEKVVLEQRATAIPNPATTATQDGEPVPEKARRLLEGILTRMQISAPVDIEEVEDAIILNIRGDGSGLLIGKRGQNLDAIQYIVNKAVHHSANGHKMIVIDTEEYRKRREESLVTLAMKIGEKVKKTNKPVTVGHMNAHDRRVIHMAMKSDETLTTKSRGEGEYRKILILPARRAPDASAA